MRKTFIFLSIVIVIFGIVFTILPLEKFGMLAALIALIFAILAYTKSEIEQTSLPKYLSLIAVATLFAAIYFAFFTESEKVEVDKEFEQEKIQSETEAKQTLESEGL